MSDGGQKRSSSSFHFFAGLSSGVLSAVLLQPADLLKTRVQQSHSTTLIATLRDIAGGPRPIRSLWRGTVPSALRTGMGSALYFSTLNALRTQWAKSATLLPGVAGPDAATGNNGLGGGGAARHSSSLPKLSSWGNLATGAIARASAGMVMMPITVIKVRFESSYYAYRSLWHAATDIVRTSGPRGFFAGFGATAVRDAPYAGLYVLFYEESKTWLSAVAGRLGRGTAEVRTAAGAEATVPDANADPTATTAKDAALSSSTAAGINFASGVTAACLATAMTNPFDAIKTRLQLLPHKYTNMGQAARLMLHEEGLRSLFDGLGIRIARKAVSSALAWTLYEELIRRAEQRWRHEAVM